MLKFMERARDSLWRRILLLWGKQQDITIDLHQITRVFHYLGFELRFPISDKIKRCNIPFWIILFTVDQKLFPFGVFLPSIFNYMR